VVQFGVRAGPVAREIPSTSLRAGSSLRLKNGYAQDDADGRSARCFFKLTPPAAFSMAAPIRKTAKIVTSANCPGSFRL